MTTASQSKKSIVLLVAAILGIVYAIYIICYFTGANASTETSSEMVGVGLATILVAPHALFVVLAAILNIIAWAKSSRALALTAAILYLVAALLFIPYAFFVVVQIVLCFVGFAKLKKPSEQSA